MCFADWGGKGEAPEQYTGSAEALVLQ
jgi:hypothetical protein